jgi:hypothetical protein
MRTNSLQDTDESFVTRRFQLDRGRCFRCHEHHELHLPAIDDEMQIGGIRIHTLLLFGYLRSKCHCHFGMCLTQRVSQIHNGLHFPFSPLEPEQAREQIDKFGIRRDQRFILHVGGNSWYKNRLGIMKIFSALKSWPEGKEFSRDGRPAVYA